MLSLVRRPHVSRPGGRGRGVLPGRPPGVPATSPAGAMLKEGAGETAAPPPVMLDSIRGSPAASGQAGGSAPRYLRAPDSKPRLPRRREGERPVVKPRRSPVKRTAPDDSHCPRAQKFRPAPFCVYPAGQENLPNNLSIGRPTEASAESEVRKNICTGKEAWSRGRRTSGSHGHESRPPGLVRAGLPEKGGAGRTWPRPPRGTPAQSHGLADGGAPPSPRHPVTPCVCRQPKRTPRSFAARRRLRRFP